MLGDTLDWPWFDDEHRRYAAQLTRWANQNLAHLPHDDVDDACRTRVRMLGEAGFLRPTVPKAYGGLADTFDVRTLCLIRETLARHDGLADFAFAIPSSSVRKVLNALLRARCPSHDGRVKDFFCRSRIAWRASRILPGNWADRSSTIAHSSSCPRCQKEGSYGSRELGEERDRGES